MNYLEKAMIREEYRDPEGCARSMMVLFLGILAVIVLTVSVAKDVKESRRVDGIADTVSAYNAE